MKQKEIAMSSLTLSRRQFESVVLYTASGEQVVITVDSISGGQVKLNFEAPKSIEIWRDELLESLIPSETC